MEEFRCIVRFMENKFDVVGRGTTPSEASIDAIRRFGKYVHDNADALYDHGTIITVCRRR